MQETLTQWCFHIAITELSTNGVDVDLRRFLGNSEDVRPGGHVQCTAHVDVDASKEELEQLRERVEATSPLMDVIANTVEPDTEIRVD